MHKDNATMLKIKWL